MVLAKPPNPNKHANYLSKHLVYKANAAFVANYPRRVVVIIANAQWDGTGAYTTVHVGVGSKAVYGGTALTMPKFTF